MSGGRPHQPTTYRGRINWPVCKRCGLVKLKNRASADAWRKPCPGKLDTPAATATL